MTARRNLIGLLGVFAIMATFAFSTTDRASAQDPTWTYSLECHADSGVWYVTDGNTRVSKSNIPCDEAKPGWTFDTRQSNFGDILFVYDDGSVHTPTGKGPSFLLVWEQGNKPPPVNQPLHERADGTNSFVYNADANNRAVRGADGQCYREQRVNGQWKRSGSYGFGTALTSQSCRRAAWNAHYRSEGEPLRNPHTGTFPASWVTLP